MASNKNSPQYIKIPDEYLIEVGILPEKPKIPEKKAGAPMKNEKLNLIQIDEEYLEEIRIDPKGFHRQSSASKRQSGANSVYNMKKTSTTIRRSNVKKEIAKKALNNVGNILKPGVQNNEKINFIPIPAEYLDALEKEVSKANVRKELFKVPMSAATSKGKLKSRTSTQLSGKYFKAPKIPSITFNNSPLPDMDKVETIMKKKSLQKTPLHLTVQTPSRLSIVKEESSVSPSTSGNTSNNVGDKLRSSTSPNSDFEAMEQMCNDQEAVTINEEIKQILGIIKTEEEEMKKYKEAHDQRMSELFKKLNTIMSKYGKTSEDNKENSARRRSKSNTPKRTPLKTGVISNKATDLRKSVLTMGLGNTPKAKQAERMYNSLRDRYGILETPKFDKKTPNSGSKNISARIQQQCLMLLDTPQSKK